MEPTDRNAAKPRLTRAQWKRRKRLRLARNWAILILVCAAIVALMTKGILWLLPKVNAMLAGPLHTEQTPASRFLSSHILVTKPF